MDELDLAPLQQEAASPEEAPKETEFFLPTPEEPYLIGVNGARAYDPDKDSTSFRYGGTAKLPDGSINPENFAEVPEDWITQGIVRPGQTFTVINSKTKKKETAIARTSAPGGKNLKLAPHLIAELGGAPDLTDLRPVKGYPAARYSSFAPENEQPGMRNASMADSTSPGPAKPDPRNPKLVSTNSDGSEIYDNGETILPDGTSEMKVAGGRYILVTPADGSKPFHVPGNGSGTEALESVRDKKAAEKGVVPSKFIVDGKLDKKAYEDAKDKVLGATDDADIADAIIRGDQPPEIGSRANAKGIRAELSRRGFDLTAATNDWNAVKSYTKTMNSGQIVKLKSSAQTAFESLSLVDDLASQWKANANLPILNKANLTLAKNGAYGKENQEIATKLEGQIANVVSEIAVVNQGGGVPTIPALTLAQKELSANWDENVLHSMTNLARKNIEIRLNSYKQLQPGGRAEPSSTPAATPSPVPAVTTAVGPAKEGKIYIKPDGRKYKIVNGVPELIP